MKNPPFEPGKYYHVYNRGNNGEKLFHEYINYPYFLELAARYLPPIANTYSYCQLPNHFHFIIRIKDFEHLPVAIQQEKKELHQAFSNWFNAYTKAINKRYHRSGSLFQEHLKRIEITGEPYLQNLITYVNTNPDHHGIANYSRYRHSSYQSLVSTKPTLVHRNDVIELYGDIENFK